MFPILLFNSIFVLLLPYTLSQTNVIHILRISVNGLVHFNENGCMELNCVRKSTFLTLCRFTCKALNAHSKQIKYYNETSISSDKSDKRKALQSGCLLRISTFFYILLSLSRSFHHKHTQLHPFYRIFLPHFCLRMGFPYVVFFISSIQYNFQHLFALSCIVLLSLRLFFSSLILSLSLSFNAFRKSFI